MKKTLAILAALALTGGAAMAERTNSITLNPDSTVAKKVNHVSSTPLTLVITVSDVDKASATLVVRNSSGAVKISTNAATVADDVYTFNLVAGNWTTNIFDSSKSIGDTETFWGDIYPLGYGAPLPAIKFSVRYGANTGSESYVDPTTGSWIAGGTTSSVINTVDMGTGAAISGSTLTLDEDLQDIAAIVPSNGLFLVGDGSDWVGESGSTARASMGLGSIATIDDAPSDGTTYGRKDGAWADAAAADTTYTNSLYADAPVTIAGTADGGSNRFGFAYNSGFTNAVRSAQTNVVDTDTTFTNSLYADAPITVTGTADGGSNRFGFAYNAGFTNEVRSAQTNVVDTDTTYTAGTNLTLNGTTFNLDTSPTLGGNLDAGSNAVTNVTQILIGTDGDGEHIVGSRAGFLEWYIHAAETITTLGSYSNTITIYSPSSIVLESSGGSVDVSGDAITSLLTQNASDSNDVAATTEYVMDTATAEGWGSGGGTVTHRWDHVYADSVGVAVGPAQPSSFITNVVYGTITQQVEFLAFDDTTTEYTGLQTWQTWPSWNSNVTFRGASWYADGTPDALWTFHYVVDGASVSTVQIDYTPTASGVTNLDVWTFTTTLSAATSGDAVHYWFSRDVADTGTGDNYIREIAIGWAQQ